MLLIFKLDLKKLHADLGMPVIQRALITGAGAHNGIGIQTDTFKCRRRVVDFSLSTHNGSANHDIHTTHSTSDASNNLGGVPERNHSAGAG